MKRVQKKQDDLGVPMTAPRGDNEGDMPDIVEDNPTRMHEVQKMLNEQAQWQLECREANERVQALVHAEKKMHEPQVAGDLFPKVDTTDKIALRAQSYLQANKDLIPELVALMDPQTFEKVNKAITRGNADDQAPQVQDEEKSKAAAEVVELRKKVAGLQSELAIARIMLEDRTSRLETAEHELKDLFVDKVRASGNLDWSEEECRTLKEKNDSKSRSIKLLESTDLNQERQIFMLERQATNNSAKIESLTDKVRDLKERLRVKKQETTKAQISEAP